MLGHLCILWTIMIANTKLNDALAINAINVLEGNFL